MDRLILLIVIIVLATIVTAFDDPYKVLNVPRTASIQQIKSNYKELARKWHPDKNLDPEAESKFIEVNKAYELLTDPERRQEFDRFGTIEDTPNFRNRHDYSSFNRFDFDPFESLFTGGSRFHFHFNSDQGTLFRRQSITTRAYENRIVPGSFVRPVIILFYGDLCLPCFQAEAVWQRIVNDLEPLGVEFATVHSQHESLLAKKLGVSSLPYIVGMTDGIVKHYKEENLALSKMIEFIRRLIPRGLMTTVDDASYEDFLSGIADNRARVIFVNKDRVIRLRYLLLAFKFKERIAAGHLSLSPEAGRSDLFTERYAVDRRMDSMLVFNEDFSKPLAALSAHELKTQIMNDVLESNKFLLLPRLSSQSLLDQLCPAETIRARRKLCVVLVTNNIPEHNIHREALRQFIREHSSSFIPKDRVRFMYMYQEKQKDFIRAISQGNGSPPDPSLYIVIFWRRESDRILYEWLPERWDALDPEKMQVSHRHLHQLLLKLSKNLESLVNDVRFPFLNDEDAHGFIGKIVKRILVMTDSMTYNITRKEIVPAVSVAVALGFIFVIGAVLQHYVKLEDEAIQERYRRLGRVPPGAPQPKPETPLNIHELRGETYNGLIRLLKPGCRTIVLIVDQSSKMKLLPKFYKNKTLMFAYLIIEKNLEWYRNILQQALGEQRELNINPKNCIGTVIALNGFRKYFCVYHAKHPEKTTSTRTTTNHTRRTRESNGDANGGVGSFLGFEDSESENEDVEAGNLIRREDLTPEEETLSNIVFEEHLLDGLSNWLDRLFDGTTQKYHIQYWPEHMK